MCLKLHRTRFLLIGFLLISLIPQCKKETQQNDIPVVSVSIAIDPNSTEYLHLNSVNGWEYITGGYQGIIVYRASTNGFMAFERACPYDWNQTSTRITVDTSGITTVCPSCNSKFENEPKLTKRTDVIYYDSILKYNMQKILRS